MSNMKFYFWSFFCYIWVHATRMSYSSSKSHIKTQYQLPDIILAIVDACIYFGLGLSYLLRYFTYTKKSQDNHFLYGAILSNIFFMLFPILSLLGIFNAKNIEIFFIALMFLYGVFQVHYWVVLLSKLNQYFTNNENGKLMGFWSASADVGNMVGFGLTSFCFLQLKWSWQIPMLVCSMILLVSSIFVYTIFQDSLVRYDKQKNDWDQFCNFIKIAVKDVELIMHFLLSAIFKSMLYICLLWLPTYIRSLNLNSNFQWIVPIAFNIAAIGGSVVIGHLYEGSEQKKQTKLHSNYLMIFLAILGVIGLWISIASTNNIVFVILIALQGFVIGGIFNMLACNQIIRAKDSSGIQNQHITTLNFGIANIGIGIVQIIIGINLSMNEDTNKARAYQSVFKVLLATSIVAVIFLIIRTCIIKKKLSQQQNQKLLQ